MNEQELVDLLKTKVDELNKTIDELAEKDIFVNLQIYGTESTSIFNASRSVVMCETLKVLRPSALGVKTPKMENY